MRDGSDVGDEATEMQTAKRLRRLGEAIRDARGEMSQADLGRLLGDVPQTTVSRWETGGVDMTYEHLFRIEVALGLEPGVLARQSPYAADLEGDLDVFSEIAFANFDEALEAVSAAEVLGLGVVLSNRWLTVAEDEWTQEWILKLRSEAPHDSWV